MKISYVFKFKISVTLLTLPKCIGLNNANPNTKLHKRFGLQKFYLLKYHSIALVHSPLLQEPHRSHLPSVPAVIPPCCIALSQLTSENLQPFLSNMAARLSHINSSVLINTKQKLRHRGAIPELCGEDEIRTRGRIAPTSV